VKKNMTNGIKNQKKVAEGGNHILCTEEEIAEANGFHKSHQRGVYIVFPKKNEVYDFTQAKEPVWVAGKPYNTVANGWSSPKNVQGKKIKIAKVIKGDEYYFGKIYYHEIGDNNE